MMKRLLPFSVFVSSVFLSYSYIPFNPSISNDCSKDSNTNGVKGSIKMFKPNTLELNSYFSNAYNNNGVITIYDQNWKTIVDTLKSPQTWVVWDKEDNDQKRLFRYFMFYDVMGMMERIFFGLKGCREKYAKNHALRKGALSGKFELKTVGVLEKEFEKHKDSKKPGKIEIIDFYDIWEKEGLMAAYEQTDIRALQEKNPGAWFQLASNFNCLEGGVSSKGLEGMNKSPVQGENAVSGTMGAGIVRAYFVKPEERDLLGIFNKTNNIKDIAVGIHHNVVVTSGYYPAFVRTNEDTLEDEGGALVSHKDGKTPTYINLNNIKPIKNDKDVAEIRKSNARIGKDRLEFLLKNKPYKKAQYPGLTATDRNPIYVFNSAIKGNDIKITQVFTAALDLNDIGKSYENINSAKAILKAMYKGTVLAAAVGGCKKLYLTLVGGGAFGNEIKWAMDALVDPAIVEAIRHTGMQVYIVVFHDIRGGRSINEKTFGDEKDVFSKLGSLDGIKVYVEALNTIISSKDIPINKFLDVAGKVLYEMTQNKKIVKGKKVVSWDETFIEAHEEYEKEKEEEELKDDGEEEKKSSKISELLKQKYEQEKKLAQQSVDNFAKALKNIQSKM